VSVDQCLRAVGGDLLDEHRRTRDADARDDVGLGDAAAGGALGAQGDRAGREDRAEQIVQRRRVREVELGSANQADSPVSHSDTGTPAAAAVAATVNACEQRSGASAPAVALTTRVRVIRSH
jgi:hypothetical protein